MQFNPLTDKRLLKIYIGVAEKSQQPSQAVVEQIGENGVHFRQKV